MILSLLGTATVKAQTTPNVWIGTTDGNWSTSTNWLDNLSPAPDPPTAGPFRVLIFSGSEDVIATNDITPTAGGLNVDDITFSEGAGSHTLQGIKLDMLGSATNTSDTSDIVNLSTNTQIIDLELIARPDYTNALIFDTANGDIVVNGIISESGATSERRTLIRKVGAHTLVLNGISTHGGIIKIDEGTLQVSSLANGNSNSTLGKSSSAPENLVFNGGTLYYSGTTNVATNRGFTLDTNGGTIKTDPGIQVTFSGIVTGTGDLTIADNSILALTSNTSNFTGNIYINNQATFKTDKLDNGSNITSPLGESTNGTEGTTDWRNASKIHLNGGTFQYTGGSAQGTVHGITLHELGGTVSVLNSGVRMDGKVTGTGDLHITGAGYLALVNNNNDYAGVTTVHSGAILEIRQAKALGKADADSYTLIEGGAVLEINPSGTGGGGSLLIEEFITVNEGGTIRNRSNTNTLTNTITLAGDMIFDTNGGILVIAAGKLSGSGDIHKTGTGVLTLNNTQSGFSGDIRVSAGTLRVSDLSTGLGTSTNPLILDGGTFNYTGSAAALERGIMLTVNGGTLNVTNAWRAAGVITGTGPLRISGSNYVAFSNNNDYTGITTIAAGAAVYVRNHQALGATGAESGTEVSGNLVFDAGGAGGIAGNLIINETIKFHDGASVTNLNHQNTLNGPVEFANGTTKGNVADGTSLTFATGISGDGGFLLDNTSGSSKTGRVILAAVNTYSGPTTLNNGNFQVGNGGVGSIASATTISQPATLSGTGSVLAQTDLSGILSPGDNGGSQIGMLTLADLALKDGSTLLFQFTSADATIANLSELATLGDPTQSELNDFAIVTDTLSSDPNAVINLQLDFSGMLTPLAEGMVFDLFDAANFAFDPNTNYNISIIGATLDPAYIINTSRFADAGIIAITVVPEPARALLLVLSLCLLAIKRRR